MDKLTKKQIDEITKYFEIGITDIEDISKLTGISTSVLETSINQDKDLSKLRQLGIKLGNIKVIKALFKSATGYEIKEVEKYDRKDRQGNVIFTDKKLNTKQIAPNFSAIKFWLSVKDSEAWKEQVSDVEKQMNLKISIEGKDIVVKNIDNGNE